MIFFCALTRNDSAQTNALVSRQPGQCRISRGGADGVTNQHSQTATAVLHAGSTARQQGRWRNHARSEARGGKRCLALLPPGAHWCLALLPPCQTSVRRACFITCVNGARNPPA